MEPSFTSVRQRVADRVLDRHLRDLADNKHVAADVSHKQRDIRLMERDLLAGTHRNRPSGASAPVYPAMAPSPELPRPASRRQSLPPTDLFPTAHTTRQHVPKPTPRSRDTNRDRPERSPSARHSPLGRQYPGDPRLETSATGTRAASETRSRGILKLDTTPSDARAEIALADNQTSANVTPNDVVSFMDPRGPTLDRGETFVKTDKYQILSFQDGPSDSGDESVEEEEEEEEASAVVTRLSVHGDISAANALLSTAKRTRRGSLNSQHSGSSGASEILRQTSLLPRRRSVHVTVPTAGSEESLPGVAAQAQRRRSSVHGDFYNDGAGLPGGDDGGFTPSCLRLPLHLLRDESNEKDNDNNSTDTGQRRRKRRSKRGKRGGRGTGDRALAEQEDVNDDENTRQEAV